MDNFNIRKTLRASLLLVTNPGQRQEPAFILDFEGKDQSLTMGHSKVPYSHVNFKARLRSIDSTKTKGDMAKARALISQLPTNTPQAKRARLQAEVKLLRDFKKFDDAYQVLTKASKDEPDDLDLRYEVAMMAEKLNRIDEMERLLKSVIEAKPDFYHAYNALGFALADRNIRLKEARELIVTALESAPDDPMITDSLGWVEFRMGNKVSALAILERAYNTKNDPEIGTHLGEVFWSLGKKDQALKIWREAKKMAPTNEILLETLKRLKVKL
jgi:tetratricopeptide (TPR) repeat protein